MEAITASQQEAVKRPHRHHHHYHYTHLMASIQDNLNKPIQECHTILDFAAARDVGDRGDSRNYRGHVQIICT